MPHPHGLLACARPPPAFPLESVSQPTNGARVRDECGLLRHYWYVACRAEALAKKPIARQILGEALVLYRDRSGRPVCFRDRCLHRNAMLSEGNLEGRLSALCPYHGWTFDSGRTLREHPQRSTRRGDAAPQEEA